MEGVEADGQDQADSHRTDGGHRIGGERAGGVRRRRWRAGQQPRLSGASAPAAAGRRLRQLAQPIAQIVSPVTPTGARGSRYKTGRLTSQKSVQESLQLSIYALACRDALGLGTPEKVTLYFTESATRMSTNRTDEQLDQAEEDCSPGSPGFAPVTLRPPQRQHLLALRLCPAAPEPNEMRTDKH
jgi:hypothetical protein